MQDVRAGTRSCWSLHNVFTTCWFPCWCGVVARPAVTSDHGRFSSLASLTPGLGMCLIRWWRVPAFPVKHCHLGSWRFGDNKAGCNLSSEILVYLVVSSSSPQVPICSCFLHFTSIISSRYALLTSKCNTRYRRKAPYEFFNQLCKAKFPSFCYRDVYICACVYMPY